jgi:hypothetical protein
MVREGISFRRADSTGGDALEVGLLLPSPNILTSILPQLLWVHHHGSNDRLNEVHNDG